MSRRIERWIGSGVPCFFLVTAVMLLVAGCDSQQQLPVYGEVRFEGQPVEVGQVAFYPSSQLAASPVAVDISKGAFVLPRSDGLRPGKYRVHITAFRKPKSNESVFAGIPLELPEQYIPTKYNDATSLEVEVQLGGDNCFEFNLDAE